MKLTDHLSPGLVKVPLESTEKTKAITELVDLLVQQNLTTARDPLLAAVLEREGQRTTGIGRGLAIPHAKCDAVSKLVIALGRTKTPIDFASVDGQPVQLIALLVSPTSATSTHIQALAKLSRLVTNGAILGELLAAKTAADLYGIIARTEVDS
jgi:PTS system fructose-specific IIC component